MEELLCAYYIKDYEQAHTNQFSTNVYSALADTAATHHYLQTEAIPHCVDILPASGPRVTVANGGTICPQHQATLLLLNTISKSAQHCYVFDDLKIGSLISLGQLCDDDCIAIFSKYTLNVVKNDKLLITGRRTDNGLWEIPLTTSPSPILSQPPSTHNAGTPYKLTEITYNNRG